MYDIVIVGAGPAGSAFARFISGHYQVLLLEKRPMDEEENFTKRKCCGGLLAPDAQKALSRLGMGVPLKVLAEPQLFSVRALDFDNDLQGFYQRFYLNIDREKFDRKLYFSIGSHVEKKDNAFILTYLELNDRIVVDYKENGEVKSVETRFLVGADGAGSRIRRSFSPCLPDADYLALQYTFEGPVNTPFYTSIFDKSITDFYSWIIPKNGCLLVGGALPVSPVVKETFEKLIVKLKEKGLIQGEALHKEASFICRPRRRRSIQTGTHRLALIGEAAGFISPSSAEGISYALRSGELLAECMNRSLNRFQKEYRKKTIPLKINIIIKNIKSFFMYHPFFRKFILRSGLFSMKVSFLSSLDKNVMS